MAGRQMLWVTRGPIAGTFLEVDDEDADLAEAEGWGQKTAGRDHMQMNNPDRQNPHEKAEAWLARQPGYANRELRASPAPSPAPPSGQAEADDEADDKPAAKPKATPPKKK